MVFFKFVNAAEKFGIAEDPKFDDPSPALLECYLNEDLELEFEEHLPNWLDFEVSEIGINCVFDVLDWPTWALNHGLCADQTFYIRVWKPEYHQDYWGEWDVDYQWEFVSAEPETIDKALRAWEKWLYRK